MGTNLVVGIWAFGGYFIRMMGDEEPEAAVEAPAGTKATHGQGVHKSISTGAVPAAAISVPAADPLAGMTVEQRHVAAMTQANQIRLAFTAQFGERSAGMVEWVDGSGNRVDQLTFDALIRLKRSQRRGRGRHPGAKKSQRCTAWTVTVLPLILRA